MMEARLKPPEYLSHHGNIAENWRKGYQRFELYVLEIEADSKPNRTKIAILLSAIGRMRWSDTTISNGMIRRTIH